MKKLEIVVNDVAYPCTPGMGAMLRFKQETGKEFDEINPNSITELFTYLYCCVVSGCKREKLPFDYKLMDFADCVSVEDMNAWKEALMAAQSEVAPEDGEKKSL